MTHEQLDRREILGIAGLGSIALAWALASRSGQAAPRFEVQLTPAEWRKRLGDARYRVLRDQATVAV